MEVWASDDGGAVWAPAALATPLRPRRLAGAAALPWPASPQGTRLVVAGGQDAAQGGDGTAASAGAALADVWASDDGGETWQQLAAAAPWGARRGHALLAAGAGELVLLGGQLSDASGAALRADVWASADGGATWTQRTAAAPWAPRFGHAAAAASVVHEEGGNGNGFVPLYVLGGAGADGAPLPSADARVWRSTDGGASWVQTSAAPPYPPRAHAAAAVLPSGAVLLLGGEGADGAPLGDQWVSIDGGASWDAGRARGETAAGLPAPRRGPALALADRTEPLSRTQRRDLYLLGGEGAADLWRATLVSSDLFWERLAEDAGTGPRTGAALLVVPTPDCGCPDKLRAVGGEAPVYDRRLLLSADGGASWAEGEAEGEAPPPTPLRIAFVPPASARRAQLAGRTRALAAAPDRMLIAVGDRGAAALAPPPHLDPAGAAAWQQAGGDPDAPPLAGKRLVAALFLPPAGGNGNGTGGRFLAVAAHPTLLDPEEEGALAAAALQGPPPPPAFGAAQALLRADLIADAEPAQLGPWAPADAVDDAPAADGVRWRAVAHSPQLGRTVAVGWGGTGGGNARVLWSDDGGRTWSGAGVSGVPDAAWWGVAWSAEKSRFVAVGPGAPPRVRRLVRRGQAAFDTPELYPPGRRARVMVSADGRAWRQPAAAAPQPPLPLAAVLWSPREGVFAASAALGGRARERLLLSADGERWFRGVREEAAAAAAAISSTSFSTSTPAPASAASGERACGLTYAPVPRALCLLGRRAPLRSGRALTADTLLSANAPLYAWASPPEPPPGEFAPLPVVVVGFEPDSRVAQTLRARADAEEGWRGAVGETTPLSGPGVLVSAPSPLHDAVLRESVLQGPAPLPDLRLFLGTQQQGGGGGDPLLPPPPLADAPGDRPIAEALGWPARILAATFVADAAQAALYAPDVSGAVAFARPPAAGVVDAFPTTLRPPENPFPFAAAWSTERFDLSLSEYYVDVALAESTLLYQDALARRSRDAWVGLGAEPAGVARYRVLGVPASPLAQLFDPALGPPPETLDLLVGVPPPRDPVAELTHTTGAWGADISGAPLQQPGAPVFEQRLAEDEELAPPAFPRRSAHAAFALGAGLHVLFGGLGTQRMLGDAWASADGGASWAQVAAEGGDPATLPAPRAHAAHAVWRGAAGADPPQCVLAGGVAHGLQRLGDVWASADGGATWTQRTAAAPWGSRRGAAMVALAGENGGGGGGGGAPAELLLVGGEELGTDASGNAAPRYLADVWASADGGATWTTRATGCPWGPRAEFALAALPAHAAAPPAQPSPALVLVGGLRQGSGRAADTWVSTDRGATWTRQPDPAPGAPAWSARRGHSLVATADVSGTLLLLAGGEGRPATRSSTLTCPFCDLWASRDLGATWFNVPNFGTTWSGRYHHRMTLDETSPAASVLLTGGFLSITLFAVDTYFSRPIAASYGWDPFLLGVRLRISNADAARMLPDLVGTVDLDAVPNGAGTLRIVRVPAEED